MRAWAVVVGVIDAMYLKLMPSCHHKQNPHSSICLEELGPDGVITRCLHVYHRSCLFNALVAKNPRAANDPRAPGPCPNCACTSFLLCRS